MKRLNWAQLDANARSRALNRPAFVHDATLARRVDDIIATVRDNGDRALIEFARELDGVHLSDVTIGADVLQAAADALAPDLRQPITQAANRIRAFHEASFDRQRYALETAPGVVCESRPVAIDRVGLYIPAGGAPLPSTVLMLVIPAQIAGCKDIVVCTPPQGNGEPDRVIAGTLGLLGIERLTLAGGAQAVAAMAYGTDSVPRCAKIFGPGNAYVTRAKQQVAAAPDGAAIDIPAGPSEVLVVADAQANPEFVAADLLAQAEHDRDAQVVLISDEDDLIDATLAALERQVKALPRAEIARAALASSVAIKVRSMAEAMAISNTYAPEHLIINTRDADALCDQVSNAGSVFLGAWTPESLGDYCSGTNHVLPTNGAARATSGVSVASFTKRITVQRASRAGLAMIGPDAMALAQAERLEAHANAVRVRL